MKRLALITFMITSTVSFAQKMELRDYTFKVLVARDQEAKDSLKDVTTSFSNIKLCVTDREIIVSHNGADDEVFKFKKRDKMSTYPNNYMFWADFDDKTYKFTFVRIANDRYYLNIECSKDRTDLVFQLKEIK